MRLLCRGGRLCPPVGSSCSTEIFGKFRCSRAFDCRGRCRSQPFATKERYGCGSAACRYTSARAVCTVFTIICGKFAASQWADVGIGPYIKTGRCIRMRPSFSQNRCILRADRVVRPYRIRGIEVSVQGPATLSAHLADANLPQSSVKTGTFCAGRCRHRPPTAECARAYGFAEAFQRFRASCRAEQGPAPTNCV